MSKGSERLPLTRRQVLALGIGAFVTSAFPFALLGRKRVARRSVPVMGTVADLIVVHDDPHRAQIAIDAAIEQLRFVDRTMSRFTDDSDVGRLNRLAFDGFVAVSRDTAVVLEEALRWAEGTRGDFDPCLGKAVGLWDVPYGNEPPVQERIAELADRRLYEGLELKPGIEPKVRFADDDLSLDLGGIAKGYGVDLAVRALRRCGIAGALVNVGGDLYALGASADGAPWRIGIRSPKDPTHLSGLIEVVDAAVATSGDYEQFFEHRGVRYHHLLDPMSAAPRRSPSHSVTVRAETCMVADAAATAVFGKMPDGAHGVISRMVPGAELISARF